MADSCSAPWRNNLSLLSSAKVRMIPLDNDLEWKQIVNEQVDTLGVDAWPLIVQ